MDRKQLNEILYSCGCCSRCQLRFEDIRAYDKYRTAPEIFPGLNEVDNDVSQSVDSKLKADVDKKKSVCPLCLGILQGICDEESVNKIGEKIRLADFDFETFSLAVALPLELQIREHSILLYLREKHEIEVCPKDVVPVKDAFKWICGPFMEKYFGVPYNYQSSFEIKVVFHNQETQLEPANLVSICSQAPPKKKRRRNFKANKSNGVEGVCRQQVEKTLENLTPEQFKEAYPCPPLQPSAICSCEVSGLHLCVYVAGRYNKYSRNLSQTPWILDGERKTESSVEELICEPIKARLRADDYKFTSSGREDVDVRTFGEGRPFAVEMINPHKVQLTLEQMQELQKEINSGTELVAVRYLQLVTREDTVQLKQSVEEKTKSYCALVWTKHPVSKLPLNKLDDSKDLVLKQKTPLRVVHRRPLAVRERTVHSMQVEPVDNHHFKLHLCTQAGTYVKEFVHGDLGRTQPNIGTLLSTEADILELDVEAVHVDWPKPLEIT